jgi:hypothetical protein
MCSASPGAVAGGALDPGQADLAESSYCPTPADPVREASGGRDPLGGRRRRPWPAAVGQDRHQGPVRAGCSQRPQRTSAISTETDPAADRRSASDFTIKRSACLGPSIACRAPMPGDRRRPDQPGGVTGTELTIFESGCRTSLRSAPPSGSESTVAANGCRRGRRCSWLTNWSVASAERLARASIGDGVRRRVDYENPNCALADPRRHASCGVSTTNGSPHQHPRYAQVDADYARRRAAI